MSRPTVTSVSWAQALVWRMERQLLDPVGSESVAGVIRRLGAVLSMDESLAELAVRTRRKTSGQGELAVALAVARLACRELAAREAMPLMKRRSSGIPGRLVTNVRLPGVSSSTARVPSVP